MQRCLQLAEMGAGHVAPNPMVGAVLVSDDRIIGEGYHRQYGEVHAEVNCIYSVGEADKEQISKSTLYVSLEPCVHFGITPPCTNLIINSRIPEVVIGCRDSFPEVDGKGIEKLKAAGVNVIIGILEKECLELNKRFFTFHNKQRPYVILKWAQSNEGIIAPLDHPRGKALTYAGTERLLISNEFTNRLVHKWRSEETSILVGTNTALLDDPSLTTRLWPGKNPVRLVIDKELKLPSHLKLFDGSTETIVFSYLKQEDLGSLHYHQLNEENEIIPQILSVLYEQKILSVMVEGGAGLLQSFIDAGLWDEARIISNELQIATGMAKGSGLNAPVLKTAMLLKKEKTGTDLISYYRRG